MISEGSCDTEDWSNDAEKSALHHRNKLISLRYGIFKICLRVCYCGNISTLRNVTWHKTKCELLLYLSVIWPRGQALAIQSSQSSQTFSRQSEGMATRD